MGIELPAELAGIAAKVGVRWPEADEDALREQATAWRTAERELTALAADADGAANGALAAMSGPAADQARRMWSGFVEPDSGRLTTAARDAGQAAQRLEHAAEQVGAAKAELVRQLVDAAKHADAATGAADAGHPAALLGLDTALRGTAANVGAVTDGLADAVGPGAGQGGPPGELAGTHPGARTADGQAGLLSAVTGLPGAVVEAALTPVETVGAEVGIRPGLAEPPDDVRIDDVPPRAPAVPGEPPAVPPVAAPFRPDPLPLPPAADADTGPIPIGPGAVTPPRGVAGGGFADAPTPPSGFSLRPDVPTPPAQTSLSGFTGGPAPSAAGPPGPGPAPAPPPPPPGAPPGPQFGPAPGGYAGGPVGGPVPGAPPGAAGPPPGGFSGQPPPRAGGGFAAAPRWGPQPDQPGQYAPHGRPPEPVRPQPPAAPVPLGSPRQERASIIALFCVHMFPIGHLPVATDRPARQLPAPPADVDYAAGLRFPPHDHPRSDVLDPGHALAWLRHGWRQPAPPPAEVLPCPPAALTEGHDPLGGLSEREWDHRYLVHPGERPEYAWPPGERYPEGGCTEGEPVLLPEGTLLDRFGTAHGRVFAADGTPFARRSLPPSHLAAGYRRYRVRREVPMWRTLSAGWFGQPGGGERFRSVYSAAELVILGYLADVTFEEVGQR
ncbi:PPE-repeat protein [Prauserella shujinwangii]|uniref:PPE-repeat protein n=1 Tax=Prauserella shujinwangii TaxID=1453103 RepID=A0A2T0LMT4_9PSEU|nr:TNT domain-containing protein [Prauserella shujinwangii]PRX44322.1 PPE-repeat protein [Prauserella shujinwangii]